MTGLPLSLSPLSHKPSCIVQQVHHILNATRVTNGDQHIRQQTPGYLRPNHHAPAKVTAGFHWLLNHSLVVHDALLAGIAALAAQTLSEVLVLTRGGC